VNVQSPTRLYFEQLKHLNFGFNADPDLAFHSNAYPDTDPASKIGNPDPDMQPCPKSTLPGTVQCYQRRGSGMLIPNPDFFHPGPLIPKPKTTKSVGKNESVVFPFL
jgi:hypothetical protein